MAASSFCADSNASSVNKSVISNLTCFEKGSNVLNPTVGNENPSGTPMTLPLSSSLPSLRA
jgi:hypothetical protein